MFGQRKTSSTIISEGERLCYRIYNTLPNGLQLRPMEAEIAAGSERILFVDDEEALIEMGEDILAELWLRGDIPDERQGGPFASERGPLPFRPRHHRRHHARDNRR